MQNETLDETLLRSLCPQRLCLNLVGEELSDSENVRLIPEILVVRLPDVEWITSNSEVS